MIEELAPPLLRSLLLGSLYSMMALGLTMTYTVTRIANFAHAEMLTVGAYVAVVVANAFGAGPVGALVVALVVTAVLAVAIDETVFKPLFNRGATALHLLVASIGVGLVVRYVLSIFADMHNILHARHLRIVVQPVAFIGRGTLTTLHLWVLPTVVITVAVLHFMLTSTKLGKAMRATASNFDLARVSGIKTGQIRRITWVIAGGLAGVAGAFWSIYSPVNPETGWLALLWIFAASILGGFVSFYGTILGGYIVGFAENVGITTMNRWFGIDVAYKPLIALAIIVAVFLLRPTGLAGITPSSIGNAIRQLLTGIRSGLKQHGR